MSNRDAYPECRSCLNRNFDPFQCEGCKKASNYEPEDTDSDGYPEELSYQEFLDLIRSGT